MTRALVATIVLVAATAHAEPRVTSPGAADYAAGVALFQKGDYAAAVERFKAAYAADDDAAYLFNIAQSYRLAHDCHLAAQFYRTFLAAMPSPPNLADVKRSLAEVEECDDDERAARSTDDEKRAPAVHARSERDDGSGRRHLAVAAAVTGVVALGVAGYFTYDAGQLANDRERLCSSGCIWTDVRARASDLDTRGARAEVIAIAGYAVAAAAIAGSVALFVTGRSEHTIAAAPVQGGAVLVLGGSL